MARLPNFLVIIRSEKLSGKGQGRGCLGVRKKERFVLGKRTFRSQKSKHFVLRIIPRFADTFREKMSRELRVGNFYLKRLTSYERIKADTDYSFGVTYDYRVRMALMAFLGLNILLCVMGTFWYRVRMRRGEIGLRMAIGSPREEIRSQMAREGICLLLMATPLALLIEAQFVMVGFLDIPKGTLPELYWPAILPLRFLLVNILTWILLAIVILLAVWLPASKAAEMEPAEALRYDG